MTDKWDETTAFSSSDVEIIERNTVYEGFFRMDEVHLRHRLYEGGWSTNITREVFLRGRAVAAIMYDPSHDLIGLVEQFRVGVLVAEAQSSDQSPWLYEVVAGMAKPGEQPTQVIERELQEEAGMTPLELIPICQYYSSPGGTDESMELFCALGDLTELSGIHGLPEEGENIRVLALPATEVFEHLYTGHFNNAASLICLQWLKLNRTKLQETYHGAP